MEAIMHLICHIIDSRIKTLCFYFKHRDTLLQNALMVKFKGDPCLSLKSNRSQWKLQPNKEAKRPSVKDTVVADFCTQ